MGRCVEGTVDYRAEDGAATLDVDAATVVYTGRRIPGPPRHRRIDQSKMHQMKPRFCAFLLLSACARQSGAPRPDSAAVGIQSRTLADEPSAVIDSTRGRLLGIGVGMSVDSVKLVLGAPLREESDLMDSVRVQVLEYPVGTIKVRGAQGVVDFLCGGDGCFSADSVGIGDSLDVILQSYGPTPPRGPAEDPEALDYRLGPSQCNLTFSLLGGRVTSLELGCFVH